MVDLIKHYVFIAGIDIIYYMSNREHPNNIKYIFDGY